MATILVSIICLVMIVVGGMTLSQGILTSTDVTALSVEGISVREGEVNRTGLDAVRAARLSWSDLLRVTVENTGQTRLASFSKWDIIVNYSDAEGAVHTEWLPYTTGNLSDNEWRKAKIGLRGPTESFEPGIVNPAEELVILARLDPLPGDNTTGDITVAAPNGIFDSIYFDSLSYTRLTPQSENISIPGTRYYELVEAAVADGAVLTFQEVFTEGGRKLLVNDGDAGRTARFLFPLVGISHIPAATWTFYYHCLAGGDDFPNGNGDVRLNADILVRKQDGTLRATIASGVATAYIDQSEYEIWVTKSGSYSFAGYDVVDENDYLEIDYYAATGAGPGGEAGYVQLSIDDDSLPEEDQTRIEA